MPYYSRSSWSPLYVTVKVWPHDLFRAVDDNVHFTIHIYLKQSILGGTIQIPMLTGKTVPLLIPARTLPGTTRVLKGYGAPKVNGQGKGAMVLHFTLALKEKLTERQRELIDEFDQIERGLWYFELHVSYII